jgi:glycosyltransferase involved in cell wall biosynthesis
MRKLLLLKIFIINKVGLIEGLMSMNIVYVGPFAYPDSSANSLRVKGVIEIMRLAGHHVQVCSGYPRSDNSDSADLADTYCADEGTKGFFANVHSGLRGLFLGDNTIAWLNRLEKKPDVIVLYGTHLGYLLRLLPFCRINNIKLFLDVVEWYDPRHLPMGLFGPFAAANELSMRCFAHRADGIFVISRYLERYFQSKGCKTLYIPPVFSIKMDRPPQFRDENGSLNICYVGSPGKKEDFSSILHGLRRLVDIKKNIKMHIVGMTKDQFLKEYGLNEISLLDLKYIKFYGRISNNDAKNIIASCDFMVILRPNQRFANAGFPSKFSESFCLGTPVLANLTSNLGEYLEDGKNSIIVKSPNFIEFSDALNTALELKVDLMNFIKKNVINTADSNFRPNNYVDLLKSFLSDIESGIFPHDR